MQCSGGSSAYPRVGNIARWFEEHHHSRCIANGWMELYMEAVAQHLDSNPDI